VSSLAADDPAHRGIMTQPLGIVHVLITSETAEHRLPEQTDQRMAPVLAGAGISEHLTSQCGQAEHVVEFAVGEQPGIGRDRGTTKLQHQTAVKIEPGGL
jgi:hypothetical protein